jgi:tetratricopeptide (TPR) repeat protein
VVTEHRPRSLSETFRGTRRLDTDVATICHKALELDPEERYDGAAALADDVGRWLSNLPIQARPPSAAYQLRKMMARHKATSAFVGTVLLLLVGLAVTMSVLRSAAEDARRQAQTAVERLEVAHADLEIVADFQARMLSDLNVETIGRHLFASLRLRLDAALEDEPDRAAAIASFSASLLHLNPTDIALGVLDEDILTQAERAVQSEFVEQPGVRARLQHSLGRTELQLGLYERAEALLLQAIATFEAIDAESNTIAVRSDLASLAIFTGEWDKAAAAIERALADGQRLLGGEHPDMLQVRNNEALLYREENKWVEAESLYAALVELSTRVLGADSEQTLLAREGRAFTWSYLERLDEAEAEYAALVPAARRRWGDDHVMTLTFLHNAGQNYVRMKRYDEALQLYQEALEGGRRAQGSDHSETLVSIVNLGRLYTRLERYPEAEAQGREALDIARRTVSPQSIDMAMSCAVLGEALFGQGRHAEAEEYLKQAYDIFVEVFGAASGGAKAMARKIAAGMESRGMVVGVEVWQARANADKPGTNP